ncbi:MAG: efflux RND transporter permease subunit, partial [Planctomycetia bacterium]|nr:efflux RND transporter permease subunit [Planctomycetia bacterium]
MKTFAAVVLRNRPAVTTIMVAIIVVGIAGFAGMRREMFPETTLDYITVTVPYPGASPEEVEEGICQKIEEYVQSIDGIKKMTSTASEGSGSVRLELETNVKDPQRVLNEVRSEVDRIPSFPQLAENKQVTLATIRSAAILLAVLGPDDEATDPDYHLKLRDLTERIRTRLLKLRTVRNVTIEGGRDFQIDIEISEATLRKYNLTLEQVATLIGRQNIDTPGGLMRTRSQEVLIRGKDKRLTGDEIAELPLVTSPEGVVLTIGDLATIRDEFNDTTAINRVNGRNCLMISVNKTTEEDLIRITDEVKEYMATELPKIVPEGYDVIPVTDMSVFVNDRISLLLTNGWQGMAIAFLFLAVFLDLKLAFWVALGVPISVLGTGAWLYGYGESLNMMSMFAFILVLGILVDDAIVIGESVHHHVQLGEPVHQAVINGVSEVAVSVMASVLTTIIAFTPLLFVPGMMGKFCHGLPIVVIAALLFSLFESLVILPVHLDHEPGRRPPMRERIRRMSLLARLCFGYPMMAISATIRFFVYPVRVFYGWSRKVNVWANAGVDWVAHHVYRPMALFGQRNPMTVLAIFVGMLVMMIGAMAGGIVPFTAMARIDSISIYAEISYPDGSTAARTERAIASIQKAIEELDQEYLDRTGRRVVKTIQEAIGVAGSSGGPRSSGSTGSNSGKLMVELVDSDERDVSSSVIVGQWREKSQKYAADFAGNRTLIFSDSSFGPAGNMIDFRLVGPSEDMDAMKEAAEAIKSRLATYEGVFDITDDAIPGKSEFRIRVKENARALGITNADIANTLRAAYYGAEVMRLQRGRHEVKLMVRYPEDERNEFSSFEDIRFRKD